MASIISSIGRKSALPPQCVYIEQTAYNVLGAGSQTFRTPKELFNPTAAEQPVFQIFHPSAEKILGDSPSIKVVSESDGYRFAHEAPVYLKDKEEVWFCSSAGGEMSQTDINTNNKVFRIKLDEAEKGKAPYYEVPLLDVVQMTNGGTLYKDGKVLFVNSGRGDLPPNLTIVDPSPPYETTAILDNFYGRQFNSINDVKVHPVSKAIFFTDVTYGYILGFRPAPLLPNQVYRFDPVTGGVRVVADGFDKCNGIAFSHDGKVAYVTDTGTAGGTVTEPATIYEYDVCSHSQRFLNRRIFAYTDKGIPDGIQLDGEGNVYSGCGDGVQVWNPVGDLIMKIYTGSTSAQMVFAGEGRMVVLGESKVYLVHFAAKTKTLDYWS